MATFIVFDGVKMYTKPKNGKFFTLREMQEFVGGYIELIKLNDKERMVVNEEGNLHKLPLNKAASEIVLKAYGERALPIVGNVLIATNEELQIES